MTGLTIQLAYMSRPRVKEAVLFRRSPIEIAQLLVDGCGEVHGDERGPAHDEPGSESHGFRPCPGCGAEIQDDLAC